MDVVSIPPLMQDPHAVQTRTLQYRVHTSFAESRCLRSPWNDLASRVGDVLGSFDWCETWWQYFGKGRRLEIHTLYDGADLVAVLPLFHETIRPGGVPLRTVRVLGCDYTIETAGLAIEPAYARRFTAMLLDDLCHRGSWDILQMAPLRPYQTAVDAMAEACRCDPKVQTVILGRQDSWCTLFELPDTYEQYLQTLSSNERCNILRRQRKICQEHDVKITRACTLEQIEQAMDALVHWHQKLWTDKGRPGQFGGTAAIERFHRAIAQRLAGSGQLALITLKADGRVLGADYGCFFGSRLHGLFRGYCRDEPWRSYGLGVMLHTQMVQLAIEHGIKEIDAGRGVFDYKLRLGGKLYGQRSLIVVRAGWPARLRFWAALRTAYLIHVLYSRIWIDMIAPRLGVRPTCRHFHVRYSVLAQLYRRVRFRLFGGPAVLEIQSLEPESRRDPCSQ